MAAPIHCDADGCDKLYDVIITRAVDGDTTSWCLPHYVALCRQLIETIDEGEREATDDAMVARLEGVTAPTLPPTSPDSSAADDPVPDEPTRPVDGPSGDEPAPSTHPTRSGRQRPPTAATRAQDEEARART